MQHAAISQPSLSPCIFTDSVCLRTTPPYFLRCIYDILNYFCFTHTRVLDSENPLFSRQFMGYNFYFLNVLYPPLIIIRPAGIRRRTGFFFIRNYDWPPHVFGGVLSFYYFIFYSAHLSVFLHSTIFELSGFREILEGTGGQSTQKMKR